MRVAVLCLCAIVILETACVYPRLPSALPMRGGGSSMSVGEWEGTTTQGQPITFVVSEDEKLIAVTLGYDFGDCSGTLKLVDLSVPTAPDLHCIPGPCSGVASSFRQFGFSDGGGPPGPYTQINGVFLPRNQAKGQAVFSNYPDCGSATVQWTASRR